MTAVPPAAVTAALLRAIADPGSIQPLPEWQARAVLEAAAPYIAAEAAAAERERIRELAVQHGALVHDAAGTGHRPFAGLIPAGQP